jgi:hypothetical protein
MLTAVEPPVRIALASVAPDGSAQDHWLVTWLVVNASGGPLVIEDAWVPHGRFRGEGHVRLAATVAPGATERLALRVRCMEPPGTVVNNAFLILRTSIGRIFARMRIEVSDMPAPVIEAVTMQSLESDGDGPLG